MTRSHPLNELLEPGEILVLEMSKKTLFVKLNDLYPECSFLIEDLAHLHPLWCLVKDSCPRNSSCLDKLVQRLRYVFEQFPQVELILLYFRQQDRPDSTRAGVFYRDFRAPRVITFNRTAWEKFKQDGDALKWKLPSTLFLPPTETATPRLSQMTSVMK